MNSTMKTRTLLLAAIGLSTLPLAALAEGDLPWLPIPGQLSLGVSHTEQSGDNAYIGGMKLPLSAITGGAASKYRRSTTQLRVDYGISDAFSVDATLGRGKVKVGAADSDSGQTDSVIGANWRVLDEYERPGLPTVTLRGAAILKGGYDGARLAAIGNDQNGVELSVLVGKQIGSSFSLWGQLGVQDRSGGVPNATVAEIGGRYRLGALSASVALASKKYGGDLDIGGPGFSPARFQEVRAERELVKLGLGYAIAGNQGVALSFAKLLDGRNTVSDDQIVGVSYSIGF
jgi:hypothetical protein